MEDRCFLLRVRGEVVGSPEGGKINFIGSVAHFSLQDERIKMDCLINEGNYAKVRYCLKKYADA